MPEVSIGPSKLIFTYRSITPEVYSLVPRMSLDFDVNYALGMRQPSYNILLSFGKSELKVIIFRCERVSKLKYKKYEQK